MSLLLKDPAGVLDYGVDWGANYLGEDALTESSWSVIPVETGGMTIDGSGFDTSTSRVSVSGGKVGKLYRLVNHVVTGQGREDSRSILIRLEGR